ncbi:MAG: SDR family oxidoreductase [Rhodospirillaceae bacterium]|mgnify:CR=1 FL=1|jgi:NAD(P)-dependent dehydrogenase (short-subunit alcohol dehydrogenase family)|nr:SDR family oxidoreductase [Rhodospirillaceae bacterium]MBT4487424.1 SDR family oxidoreductase [Rhodospirillaceae bacterium]MBT5193562.1 SDR family oxidoreductase [Rhodospirillaceae bacterium]MBT5896521.1 SDR family oxidoreductase [Rhodospirillaceae bacterium]MBT6426019.1 SDR family oxidoreductase [Rhodospirillaceae bacterium]
MEVCLITGTSTGIGQAAALHLARRGYKVYASMRNTAKGDALRAGAAAENLDLVVETLDVSDNQSMLACIERIIAAEGRIDVLINNAGLSSSSPIETYPEDEHRALFEANYWGPVKLTQAVLPGMRERGRGAIINLSSLLGRIAWANQAAYCASKFAIEAFSESLAQEVAPFGIRVAIIEPGVTASAIFDNTPVHYDRASPYKPAMRRNGRFYNVGVAVATPAERLAETIAEALTSEQPKLRYAVGFGAQAIARRADMSDEDFVALGGLADPDYYQALREHLDLELEPPEET